MSQRRIAFRQALKRLREVLGEHETAITRDAAIQRFEFSFELCWKAIQEAARGEGIDCASPKGCGRTAWRLGWIDSETGWLAILEDPMLEDLTAPCIPTTKSSPMTSTAACLHI